MGQVEASSLLAKVFADAAVCSYMLASPTYDGVNPRSFDSSTIGSVSPPELALTEIYAGTTGTAATQPNRVIFKSGQQASASISSLIVSNIKIKNIQNIVGPNYSADLVVSFDSAKLIRPVPPVTQPIFLATTGAGTVRTISACSLTPPFLPRAFNCRNSPGGNCIVNLPASTTQWMVTLSVYYTPVCAADVYMRVRDDAITSEMSAYSAVNGYNTRGTLTFLFPASPTARTLTGEVWANCGFHPSGRGVWLSVVEVQ